jgi:hypothetical protein
MNITVPKIVALQLRASTQNCDYFYEEFNDFV